MKENSCFPENLLAKAFLNSQTLQKKKWSWLQELVSALSEFLKSCLYLQLWNLARGVFQVQPRISRLKSSINVMLTSLECDFPFEKSSELDIWLISFFGSKNETSLAGLECLGCKFSQLSQKHSVLSLYCLPWLGWMTFVGKGRMEMW